MKKTKHLHIIVSIVIFLILCGAGVYAIVNRPQPKPVAAITSSSAASILSSSKAVTRANDDWKKANGIKGSDGLIGTDPTEKTVRQELASQGYTQTDIDNLIKQGYQDGTFQNKGGSTTTTSKPSGGTTSKPSNGGTTSKPTGGTTSKPSNGGGSNQGEDNSTPLPPGAHTGGLTDGAITTSTPGTITTNPGTDADGVLN